MTNHTCAAPRRSAFSHRSVNGIDMYFQCDAKDMVCNIGFGWPGVRSNADLLLSNSIQHLTLAISTTLWPVRVILPASAIKVFIHFSIYSLIAYLLLKPNCCTAALPRHIVGCAISRTPPRSELVLTSASQKTKDMARHNRISSQHSRFPNADLRYNSASYLHICSLTSIARADIPTRRASCHIRRFD